MCRQDSVGRHPSFEDGSGEDANLNLRHVQPTGVLGRGMELESSQEPRRFGLAVQLGQVLGVVGVEVVLDNVDGGRGRVHAGDEVPNGLGPVATGSVLRGADVPATRLRFQDDELVAHALPLVLVVGPSRCPTEARRASSHGPTPPRG